MSLAAVKALTFDVFGTVVDWRGGYRPSMDRVARGELPWTNIDTLHRMILDGLLDEFGIAGLSESDKDHLNRAWHRLQP